MKTLITTLIIIAIVITAFVILGRDTNAPEERVTPMPIADGGNNNQPEFCIEIYDPVCGDDGKTYGNECFAGLAGVSVAYEGECR